MSVVTRALVDPRIRLPLRAALFPLALILVVAAVQVAFAERIVPGVRVAGVAVGGYTVDAARAAVAARAESFADDRVIVRVGDRAWASTDRELGLYRDVDAAVASAFAVGHEGSMLGRLGAWADALVGGVELPLARRARDDRLAGFVRGIASAVDRAPVEGAIAITSEGVRVTEPVDGVRVPRESLTAALLGGAGARDVTVSLEMVGPEIGVEAMRDARLAAGAAYSRLDLIAGEQTISLDPPRLASLVRIEKDADGAPRLVASVDPAALDALVAELAPKIEQPLREASFRFGASGIEVVPGQPGVTLDREALARAIASAFFTPDELPRAVSASVAVVDPKLTTAAARDLAARMTVLAQYTTYYPVNPERGTNIRIGAARFDGLVLQPGESFSFWDRIGEVSYRTGFLDSGAIIDGRSDKALGGGLCQVSTTLFGAVARSGYRIDERSGHSYYIERYQLGLDAAVFFPGQDFRWTNDTGAPVIVGASSTATSVTFSLWSVPAGRTVSFSAPAQRNLVMPKAEQPADPAHPKGYVVQGRDVWVTRTVSENGAVVHRETFFTHYAPVWGGAAETLTVR